MSDPAEHRIEQVNCSEIQPLLPAALSLYRLGLSVVPVRLGTKKPAVKWKRFQRERADEATLRTWFADTDNTQLAIGVVLGEVSGGLLVRDFDEEPSYAAWKRSRPDLAAILPTALARRGPHVYLRSRGYKRADATSYVRNCGDGELRGDGHIVVAPPSLHSTSGRPYRWLIEPTDPIPLIDLHAFSHVPQPGAVTHAISVLHPGPRPPVFVGDRSDRSVGPSKLSSNQPAHPPASVADAIRLTLPTGGGQRHRKLFEFARCLKGISELANLDASELQLHVRTWHAQALPVIVTKDFAETWRDFQAAWVRVRSPAGSGSLSAAWQRAVSSPLPPEAEQFESPQIRLLVSLCRELQREHGSAPFYLSCRDAAAALGLYGSKPHVAAWRWLKMLCHVGILEPGRIGTMKDRTANEYRYLPEFPRT